jgi:uncharacterized protein
MAGESAGMFSPADSMLTPAAWPHPRMTESANMPRRAGVGLKASHYQAILEQKPDVRWFEVHAENYMGDGGSPLHFLDVIRNDYPISLHGVGLSIGSHEPLDENHLARLKALNDRFQPALVSEHLAWSSHAGIWFNDLLPAPYTEECLSRVCDHMDRVQDVLGRPILLENPATYVTFENSTMDETDFISAVIRRTGCGLLLDVNNVYVSAVNHGYAPESYIAAMPADAVGEIHLAGHAPDTDDDGNGLLIDAHDRAIADVVWALYCNTILSMGVRPTLIEWDNDIPDWPVLMAEAQKADHIIASHRIRERYAAAG